MIKSEESDAIWCEDFPGCFSQGENEEEAIENIENAIQEYLEARNEVNRISLFVPSNILK